MDCTAYPCRVTVRPTVTRKARREIRDLHTEVGRLADWIELVERGEYAIHNPARSIALARHEIDRAAARISELEHRGGK